MGQVLCGRRRLAHRKLHVRLPRRTHTSPTSTSSSVMRLAAGAAAAAGSLHRHLKRPARRARLQINAPASQPSSRGRLAFRRKVTVTSSSRRRHPQTCTGRSRWITMWLVRILGRVTCADKAAPGKRTRSKSESKFQGSPQHQILRLASGRSESSNFPERERYQSCPCRVSLLPVNSAIHSNIFPAAVSNLEMFLSVPAEARSFVRHPAHRFQRNFLHSRLSFETAAFSPIFCIILEAEIDNPTKEDRCLRMRTPRTIAFALMALAVFSFACPRCHAQAALLMEEPYGFFGALNPTGHTRIYFERICAETPVKLRRCAPGEMGAVIARYQGIDGYDWVAIPLIPYLYSVENRIRSSRARGPRHRGRACAIAITKLICEPWRRCARRRPAAWRLDGAGRRGLRAAHLCLPLRNHRGTGRCLHRADERRRKSLPLSICSSATAPILRA